MISGVCPEDIPFAHWVLMLGVHDMRLKTCVIFRDSKSDKDYFCGREKSLSFGALKRLDFTLGLPEMRTRWYPTSMAVTLAQIHEDPAILDRAIASQETLEIVSCGELAATLMPRRVSALEQARQGMDRRFAAPDWSFTVGIPLTREERNARS
jgi:hypothetical protein